MDLKVFLEKLTFLTQAICDEGEEKINLCVARKKSINPNNYFEYDFHSFKTIQFIFPISLQHYSHVIFLAHNRTHTQKVRHIFIIIFYFLSIFHFFLIYITKTGGLESFDVKSNKFMF